MIRNILRFVIILGLACLVMGGGVAILYACFQGRLAARDRAATQEAIRAVVPEGAKVDLAKPLAGSTKDGSAVYAAVAADAGARTVAWVAAGEAQGYSSVVKVMVGVTKEGNALKIHKVAVLSQAETPGLGATVAETRSTYTLWQKLFGSDEPERVFNPFLRRFETRQAGQVRDIQAMTAATITSNATKAAVAQAIGRIQAALQGTP